MVGLGGQEILLLGLLCSGPVVVAIIVFVFLARQKKQPRDEGNDEQW